jgi:alpha-tubulin suppressor-like RCC1 family protein
MCVGREEASMRAALALMGLLLSAGAASAESATAVFADYETTCALRSDGGVSCWGNTGIDNPYGPYGISSSPIDIPGLPAGVVEIAMSDVGGRCARTSAGAVHCWGQGFQTSLPSLEPGLESGIAAISPACGLTTEGGVFCHPYVPRTYVENLESGVAAISTVGPSCALMATGGVRCWGNNFEGQLGNGESSGYEEAAVNVVGLSSGVVEVETGGLHACALRSNGEVWCWGSNRSGELGNGTFDNSNVPVQVSGLPAGVSALSLGTGFSCALAESGVWCWGSNQDGRLGSETPYASPAPVAVTGLPEDVVGIVSGYRHSCAFTGAGAIHCWGSDDVGQLGLGTRLMSNQPVLSSALPPNVASYTEQGCVITSAGGFFCLGPGGAYVQSEIPQPVIAVSRTAWLSASGEVSRYVNEPICCPPPVEQLLTGATALDGGYFHDCALKATGSVWCWGQAGSIGVLGPSTDYPVQVTSLGNTVTALTAGYDYTCARTSAGAALCWGYGYEGSLGHGTTSSQALPTPVDGLGSGVAALSAGFRHTCALTTGGGVLCWGANDQGQLGDGTTTKRLSPVPVTGLSSGAAAIAAGEQHTCALMLDGSMRCWGSNALGKLGDASYTNRLTPVVVSGIAGGVSHMYLFDHNTCVVMTDGSVRCWGNNRGGELGDGSLLARNEAVVVPEFDGAPAVPALGAPWLMVLAASLLGVGRRRLR